ncbi:papain family cysteine protease domain-containing protein [Ditylenchus destructor]|uniref:Papain family cysteine protease domain-containing protein n=1 Tax=Ditylenchus destructor TaxID=166010 RepID=A0AAD4QWX0_9BILA|nr:papain family cysteine protease domain-containing protein [Ditylenchus destructor]
MFPLYNFFNIILCITLHVKFGFADSIVVDTLGQNDDDGPPDGWNPSRTDIDEWNEYKKQFPDINRQHGETKGHKCSNGRCGSSSSEKANITEYWSNISERERVFAFVTSKNLTEEHNSKFAQSLVTFKLSLNHLADVPLSYIRKRNNYKVRSKKHKRNIYATIPKSDKGKENENLNRRKRETPDSKDYMRFMTPVRNQGQCGSCWAFSSTAALEAHYNMAVNNDAGTLTAFAPQQLVDCLAPTSAGDYGCSGNYIDSALLYAKQNNGIAKETSYPYTAMDGYCHSDSSSSWQRAHITSYHYYYLDANIDENTLKDTLAEVGPIVVVIDSNAPKFALYAGGVYYDPDCTENPVHAMLLVGYGTDPNFGDYWLIKNSWDTTWGENGYMRLARNRGNHCGITVETAYPVVVGSDDTTNDSNDEDSGSTDSTNDSLSEHSDNISIGQVTKQTWGSSDVDEWNQYIAKYTEKVNKWNQKMANSAGTTSDWERNNEQYKKLTAEYKRKMKEYNRRFPGAANSSPNNSAEYDSAGDCSDDCDVTMSENSDDFDGFDDEFDMSDI